MVELIMVLKVVMVVLVVVALMVVVAKTLVIVYKQHLVDLLHMVIVVVLVLVILEVLAEAVDSLEAAAATMMVVVEVVGPRLERGLEAFGNSGIGPASVALAASSLKR